MKVVLFSISANHKYRFLWLKLLSNNKSFFFSDSYLNVNFASKYE